MVPYGRYARPDGDFVKVTNNRKIIIEFLPKIAISPIYFTICRCRKYLQTKHSFRLQVLLMIEITVSTNY